MRLKALLQGLAISATTFVLILLILEVVFRAVGVRIDDSYPNDSWWWRAKWFNGHRYNANRLFYPIDEFHPLYGWILKAGLRDVKVSGAFVSSNGIKVRGTQEFDLDDTSKRRLLAIGDSFTFGECAGDSESYPAILQSYLPQTDVLNAAVHGWGIDQILLRLQREGADFKPSIVMLGCVNNDLTRNHLWFRDFAKPYFVLEEGALKLKGAPILSPEEMLSGFHSELFDWVSSKWHLYSRPMNIMQDDSLSEKLLEQVVREIRRLNAVPVFVYLPGKDENIAGVSRPAASFKKVSERENVLWVDPIDSIHAAVVSLPAPEKEFACHYTPLVNRAIAVKIHEQLVSSGVY